jgi:adenylate cyclase
VKQFEYKRKLTAILSADAVGYSRLIGENEVCTIHTLKQYKEAITKLVKIFRGRVVDAPGDNLLAEFASVVDAMHCAVEIQREISECNEEQPQESKMKFRIGVNLGDVVEEDDRIYGDGVNIAARVEGLAEAGGICITGAVFEQVKNKIEADFEYIGQQKVKNIADPIEVYRIGKISSDAPTSFSELTPLSKNPELPEKPSVAVLPFENLTGDSSQEFIGDGITESIIIALSKLDELFVIARHSSFSYKDKQISVEQISRDLGVRFILGGSILQAGQRIRITAWIADATSGHHLWTEKFDHDIADFFSLLDEISQKTTVSLQVKLTQGVQALGSLDTRNFEAWSCYVKAADLFQRFTRQDNIKARELLYEAVNVDSEFALAWVILAWTYFVDVRFGFTKDPAQSLS